MTREEREKAIDALKISVPIHALTEEKFNDYIQTLNKIMDWLEQEPIIDKIKAEIDRIEINGQVNAHTMFIRTGEQVKQMALNIIDKYKTESEENNAK